MGKYYLMVLQSSSEVPGEEAGYLPAPASPVPTSSRCKGLRCTDLFRGSERAMNRFNLS